MATSLEFANFEPADPLKTPAHIAPVWYYTPSTRCCGRSRDKFGGLVVMKPVRLRSCSVLPWLDRSPVKSIRCRVVEQTLPVGVRNQLPDLGRAGRDGADATADPARAGLQLSVSISPTFS